MDSCMKRCCPSSTHIAILMLLLYIYVGESVCFIQISEWYSRWLSPIYPRYRHSQKKTSVSSLLRLFCRLETPTWSCNELGQESCRVLFLFLFQVYIYLRVWRTDTEVCMLCILLRCEICLIPCRSALISYSNC